MARKFIPLDPKMIQQIESMAGIGIPVEQIAAVLGMSKKTLERRVANTRAAKDALLKGRALANTNVAKRLYEGAIGGNPTLLIFWAKTRMGWKETSVHEHADPDGKPLFSSIADLVVEAAKQDGKTRKADGDPEGA